MTKARPTVLVIGSGAGGATTAATLAEAGFEVVVIEEGPQTTLGDYGQGALKAMAKLYRRRGMTPIFGRVPIGFVEGCCVGGSTEINSGFWARATRETLLRWQVQFDLRDSTEQELAPHFQWAEQALGVCLWKGELPASSKAFARGVDAVGWTYQQVPRAAPGCSQINQCANGCPSGAKKGMSQTLLPRAVAAGAKIIPGMRALLLLRSAARVESVIARKTGPGGSEQLVRFSPDYVFVCCGPTETPALLQRSGIRYRVGSSLRIHPYLKVAARFSEPMDSDNSVLPLFQVKEFLPDITLGGAYYSTGHLAMGLSDNWPEWRDQMDFRRNIALFYVGVRGTGPGSVRPSLLDSQASHVRYDVSDADLRNLSIGLARLSTLLLAGGAEAVYPSVYGHSTIQSETQAVHWLDQVLPRSALSLVTVHAFSSCPIGENRRRCVANSMGQVHGLDNLYLADASILPDSPGVNPQASVMALSRRNALAFADKHRPG